MRLHLLALLSLLFRSRSGDFTVTGIPLGARGLTAKASKKHHKQSYEGCQFVKKCAKSFEELQEAIVEAVHGEFVGICGDIRVDSTPIRIVKSDVTLVGCCTKTKCAISGSGKAPNLVVTGGDFSLFNVIVEDGHCDSTSGQGGGNFHFRSTQGGSLTVVDSEFCNGVCDIQGAGNVDVSTTGSVTFRRTAFKNGKASFKYSGGGAFVTESFDIIVDGCLFDGNKEIGLALYSGSGDGYFEAVIKDSVFLNNEGGPAGGIFYSDFGSMQRLEVLRTEFTSNTATDEDGAGAAQISQNILSGPTTFFWDGNFGSGNRGPACPDVLYYWDGCFAVDSTYTPS
ncbi:hypothetical protein IV203_038553 [Nitzschia inconspicua]|uniref:Right handed beta helix domain-containing protein n=1 Tax=Nitzschia inconspicua TaxID=303405 RepID=A0A9K3PZX2_9STRA|nr:hypothetical protein IV203_038553 [Nitzschia inconspicua]